MAETLNSPSIPQRGSPENAGSTSRPLADPAETDKALEAALKRSLGQPVSIRTRWIDPEAGESYEVLAGVDWPEMTLQQAQAALGEIQAAMAPADERSLGALLAELWLVTAKQNTAGADQQALAGVYIRQLRDWPGDIALEVLRRAKCTSRWWPPLADLCRQCTDLARRRCWLLSSLQDRIDQLQRPAVSLPAVQRMPTCGKTKAGGFWSVDRCRNVDRLAQLEGITRKQALGRLLAASPDELLALEEAVRSADGAPDPSPAGG